MSRIEYFPVLARVTVKLAAGTRVLKKEKFGTEEFIAGAKTRTGPMPAKVMKPSKTLSPRAGSRGPLYGP